MITGLVTRGTSFLWNAVCRSTYFAKFLMKGGGELNYRKLLIEIDGALALDLGTERCGFRAHLTERLGLSEFRSSSTSRMLNDYHPSLRDVELLRIVLNRLNIL